VQGTVRPGIIKNPDIDRFGEDRSYELRIADCLTGTVEVKVRARPLAQEMRDGSEASKIETRNVDSGWDSLGRALSV